MLLLKGSLEIISLVFFVFDLVHVVHGPRVSSSWHSIFSNSCQNHSPVEALLKSTILTTVSLGLVDLTVSISYAVIDSFVLNGSFEKAFAPKMRDSLINIKR